MGFAPYRTVLAVPGVRTLLLVGIAARIPATAVGITLTLHVANTLGHSWAQAGLVTAAYTIGGALGLPLTGRLIDRRGLRTVMVLTAVVSALVWFSTPRLSYALLLPAAFLGGLFAIPIFPAIRLALGAMVPPDRRRPAFALDSMIVELSFMVGPALAVLVSTGLPAGYGLYALGGGIVVTGTLMYVMNPPTRPAGDDIPAVAAPRRTWFGPRLVALMVVALAATVILSATDLAIVATMRDAGAVAWTGLAIALWCLYSLVGGLVFGMIHRPVSVLLLVGVMGLLTIPVAVVTSWPWLLVALIPSGVLCAPCMVAANDNLARIVPPTSRGEATGLLGSAFTAGVTLGAPFAGLVIDGLGPRWAFAAAGAVGAVAALAALPVYRRSSSPAALAPVNA